MVAATFRLRRLKPAATSAVLCWHKSRCNLGASGTSHLENLYQVSRLFLSLQSDIALALRKSLTFIVEVLNFDRTAVFFYDADSNTLSLQQILEQRGVLEGETVYSLNRDTNVPPVKCLIENMDCLVLPEPEYCICVPLKLHGEIMGVLSADNALGHRSISDEQTGKLRDYAGEIAVGLWNARLYAREQEEIKKLLAFSEITQAIISSMNLERILRTVMHALITQIGFDRARLYMVDKEAKVLKGRYSAMIGQGLKELDESVPLKSGISQLVDMVLENKQEYFDGGHIYRTLLAGRDTVGIVQADNIFSRQQITRTDLKTLGTFANLASVAIFNAQLFEEVQRLSITDGLTGLYVYRYFSTRLSEEITRARRFGGSVTMILFDVDHFKEINDRHGHPFGDKVLKEVSTQVKKCIREVDSPARYGGDEFAIILPGASCDMARRIAERIQTAISSPGIKSDSVIEKITISIGIAAFPEDADTDKELIKKADTALYAAKRLGRARIVTWSEDLE